MLSKCPPLIPVHPFPPHGQRLPLQACNKRNGPWRGNSSKLETLNTYSGVLAVAIAPSCSWSSFWPMATTKTCCQIRRNWADLTETDVLSCFINSFFFSWYHLFIPLFSLLLLSFSLFFFLSFFLPSYFMFCFFIIFHSFCGEAFRRLEVRAIKRQMWNETTDVIVVMTSKTRLTWRKTDADGVSYWSATGQAVENKGHDICRCSSCVWRSAWEEV